MIKKTKIYTLKLALLIFVISACEKPIQNFELKNHDPKITLNAILSTDSVARVFISRSKDLIDNLESAYIINNPEILLIQGSNRIKLEKVNDYFYESPSSYINSNLTYELEASAQGYETVFGSVSIPEKPSIGSVDTSFRKTTFPGCIDCFPEFLFRSDVQIADMGNSRDFYQIEFNILDQGNDDEELRIVSAFDAATPSPFIEYSGSRYSLHPSDFVGGSNGSSGHVFYFSDQSFNGRSITLSFYSSYYSFTYSRIPMYDEEGQFLGNEYSHITPHLSIRLSRVTEELFYHLKALANNNNLGDMPLTEPVFIPTNIENGLGIIGAKATSETLVNLQDVFKQVEIIIEEEESKWYSEPYYD